MAAPGLLAVFAPAPLLTVTVERTTTGDDEIHVHPGGQGYWIARLASLFDIDVTVCASAGGEAGGVVAGLLAREPFELRLVEVDEANGCYVHDRRSGERVELVETSSKPIGRHGVDDLFNIALVAGIEAGTLACAGPPTPDLLPEGFYRRLVTDVRASGGRVVADVSGAVLDEVVEAGAEVVKVSSEELVRDGLAADEGDDAVVAAATELLARGAGALVVTRAAEGTLLVEDGGAAVTDVTSPPVTAFDPRGAGDSLTASVAACLAGGGSLLEGVRLGAAAGALNVTRHGLGSGRRDEITKLAEHVGIHPRSRG